MSDQVYIAEVSQCSTHVGTLCDAEAIAQSRADEEQVSYYVYECLTAGSDTHVPVRLVKKIDPQHVA